MTATLPSLASAGNREMAQQIGNALRDSGQLANYNINVKYSNGTASLTGRVTSQQQMAAAVAIAEQCPQVANVVNDLTIVPPTAAQRPSFPMSAVKRVSANAPVHDFGPQLMAQQAAARPPMRGPKMPPSGVRPAGHHMRRPPAAGYCPLGAGPYAGGVVYEGVAGMGGGRPLPAYVQTAAGGAAPMMTDNPNMPNYAWPSYASYPNYAALTYPKQYSATAWPYIGPFYPYPQVPLGWRKVTLEWDDGWWFLDFKDCPSNCWEP
jgi:hypothetical protein